MYMKSHILIMYLIELN